MDEQSRKIALRMISYGVYILTSKVESEVSAATVTWVSQASFKPPMLSVCIKRDSGPYKVIKERKEFLSKIYYNLDGKATNRAVEVILDFAENQGLK